MYKKKTAQWALQPRSQGITLFIGRGISHVAVQNNGWRFGIPQGHTKAHQWWSVQVLKFEVVSKNSTVLVVHHCCPLRIQCPLFSANILVFAGKHIHLFIFSRTLDGLFSITVCPLFQQHRMVIEISIVHSFMWHGTMQLDLSNNKLIIIQYWNDYWNEKKLFLLYMEVY